jgi:hypothetical protein
MLLREMPLFDTDDGLVVTQEGRDARARTADMSVVFTGCDREKILAIYQEVVRDARGVFEPRWAAVRGPNLHKVELAGLLQEAALQWMHFYISKGLAAQVTPSDWEDRRTLRIVQKYVERSFPVGSDEANALCVALMGRAPPR